MSGNAEYFGETKNYKDIGHMLTPKCKLFLNIFKYRAEHNHKLLVAANINLHYCR